MIPLSYQIETNRMILRAPSEEDIPSIFEATRYKGFNDGMRWNPPVSEEELKAPLQKNLKHWKNETAYVFSMDSKAEKYLIGRISIHPREEEGLWSIGFWTHPKHQGQGFMTEAVQAILAFGFHTLSATMIEASYAIWNKASQKVMEKNNMTFVKYIEKAYEKNGTWVNINVMAITKKEFLSHENL